MTDSLMILAGGLSHERDVSIRSGRRVAEALRARGVDAVIHDIDHTLLQDLDRTRPSCVIPLVHGASGEDGSLRDVLDALGIPYVGSRPDACRLAFDKMVAKAHLAEVGIPTPPAVALPHPTFRDLGAGAVLDALVARIGLPLVVKPTRGGSALGVTIVRDASELPTAMVGCFSYGDTAMLEQYVPGTEVAVSVIERADGSLLALPAVEIRRTQAPTTSPRGTQPEPRSSSPPPGCPVRSPRRLPASPCSPTSTSGFATCREPTWWSGPTGR